MNQFLSHINQLFINNDFLNIHFNNPSQDTYDIYNIYQNDLDLNKVSDNTTIFHFILDHFKFFISLFFESLNNAILATGDNNNNLPTFLIFDKFDFNFNFMKFNKVKINESLQQNIFNKHFDISHDDFLKIFNFYHFPISIKIIFHFHEYYQNQFNLFGKFNLKISLPKMLSYQLCKNKKYDYNFNLFNNLYLHFYYVDHLREKDLEFFRNNLFIFDFNNQNFDILSYFISSTYTMFDINQLYDHFTNTKHDKYNKNLYTLFQNENLNQTNFDSNEMSDTIFNILVDKFNNYQFYDFLLDSTFPVLLINSLVSFICQKLSPIQYHFAFETVFILKKIFPFIQLKTIYFKTYNIYNSLLLYFISENYLFTIFIDSKFFVSNDPYFTVYCDRFNLNILDYIIQNRSDLNLGFNYDNFNDLLDFIFLDYPTFINYVKKYNDDILNGNIPGCYTFLNYFISANNISNKNNVDRRVINDIIENKLFNFTQFNINEYSIQFDNNYNNIRFEKVFVQLNSVALDKYIDYASFNFCDTNNILLLDCFNFINKFKPISVKKIID